MAGKDANYQAEIHDREYAAPYTAVRLDRRGLIDASGRETESLNGSWSFGADWYDTCLRSRWFLEQEKDGSGRPLPRDYDWRAWETMTVPSCWNLERAELRYFEGSGVYTREFRFLPRLGGERVFLRFEGAQYRATLFLNGACLGTHDGGSTPFCAEITGAVRPDNRIIVVVEARRRRDRVPEENTDWFHYGGIYRDVLLVRTPSVFIRDWFLRLVPDGGFGTIALDLHVDGADSAEARLRIPDLDIDVPVPARNGAASVRIPARPELSRLLASSKPNKPVVVCEFGGDARAGFRGGVDKLFSEDMQAHIYQRQLETPGACSYIKGLSPWILYDFRSPRRINRHQEGFNRKGLVDADRVTRKKAFAVLRDFYGKGRP